MFLVVVVCLVVLIFVFSVVLVVFVFGFVGSPCLNYGLSLSLYFSLSGAYSLLLLPLLWFSTKSGLEICRTHCFGIFISGILLSWVHIGRP